jgi:hypothetical protein
VVGPLQDAVRTRVVAQEKRRSHLQGAWGDLVFPAVLEKVELAPKGCCFVALSFVSGDKLLRVGPIPKSNFLVKVGTRGVDHGEMTNGLFLVACGFYFCELQRQKQLD